MDAVRCKKLHEICINGGMGGAAMSCRKREAMRGGGGTAGSCRKLLEKGKKGRW